MEKDYMGRDYMGRDYIEERLYYTKRGLHGKKLHEEKTT